MRFTSVAVFAVVVAAMTVASASGCLEPTQLTIEITTDVKCPDVKGTNVTIGNLGDVEAKPPTTETTACDPAAARIGSIVVVPSGSDDGSVAVRVVMGLGKDPSLCVPPGYGPGCIVARRALHYLPHQPLTLPIFMSAVCNGIGCGETETCVKGDCRPATIEDVETCASGGGCGEEVLAPASSRPPDAGPPRDSSPADTGRVDAADAADACGTSCLDPTKVTLSFSAGKDQKVYRFDVTTKTFTVLTSTNCPVAEETAVTGDGTMYITSQDNLSLFRWSAAAGCTLVHAGTTYPFAFGTAPKGTVSQTAETLVGYGGPDYVRVNPVDGIVTVITPGALGTLQPSGDLTAIGARGFLAALAGTGSGAFACPATGDCIVELNLTTGVPIKLLDTLAGFSITGIAHSRGDLLLYANGQVSSYVLATRAVTQLAAWPAGASFSGAGASAYPVP